MHSQTKKPKVPLLKIPILCNVYYIFQRTTIESRFSTAMDHIELLKTLEISNKEYKLIRAR